MAKNKATLLKEAAAAGVTGLTEESTVKEIREAIAAAGSSTKTPATSSRKPKAKTGEQLQEERLARSRANRDAELVEKAEADLERARNEERAAQAVRSGPQQALDRAAESGDSK